MTIFNEGWKRMWKKQLASDKKGSTTSMKNHLDSKHCVRDANLPNQSNRLEAFKKVATGHVAILHSCQIFTLYVT